MDDFKTFFGGDVQRRHRRSMPGTDMTRKHVNIVPQKYINDNTLNQKIETLKKRPGRFFCDDKDLQYIATTFFKGRLPESGSGETRVLGGKLNINFYQDPQSGRWVIEKK